MLYYTDVAHVISKTREDVNEMRDALNKTYWAALERFRAVFEMQLIID
jgi:hypothetical protein